MSLNTDKFPFFENFEYKSAILKNLQVPGTSGTCSNASPVGARVWLNVHYISSASSHLIIGTYYFLINLIYTVECKDFSKFSTISMLTLKPSAHFRVPGRSYENWGCFHTWLPKRWGCYYLGDHRYLNAKIAVLKNSMHPQFSINGVGSLKKMSNLMKIRKKIAHQNKTSVIWQAETKCLLSNNYVMRITNKSKISGERYSSVVAKKSWLCQAKVPLV